MRKLLATLFFISIVYFLPGTVSAQYSIPIFDAPVITDPTTFEEGQRFAKTSTRQELATLSIQRPISRGEKELHIKVKDRNASTTATATIEVYSIDANFTYGPYIVLEGQTFNLLLNDSYDYGVITLFCTEESTMSVWYE